MQGQMDDFSSFPETLGFDHGSTSSGDVASPQSNQLSDYISLNSTNQEEPNPNLWNVGQPNSNSDPNPIEPRPDRFEFDDNRTNRKRKSVELNIGSSSSSNSNRSDEIIPRLGLSVDRVSSSQQDPLTDPLTTPENSSSQLGQPVLRIPILRRNLQSTSRSRSSSSRVNRVNIEDHSHFAPPGGDASSPIHHSRRLSAFFRRSLLSATDLEEGGSEGQNGLFPPVLNTTSSSSQDMMTAQQHHSRSSLLVGTMTGGSEGRGRLVSEIRNVLDLMRRGEPLRFEDLMILDQSVFYGIADIHDRHRDMRLDIDNMSYEELLALEERIGNVNTGLTDETISKHLKKKQYVVQTSGPDVEPCCICQDEYKDGDDLGTLECGHDFHGVCIKKWLQHKNSCPVCKSTGFTMTRNGS